MHTFSLCCPLPSTSILSSPMDTPFWQLLEPLLLNLSFMKSGKWIRAATISSQGNACYHICVCIFTSLSLSSACRNMTLTFRPGEARLFFTVAISNDTIPEIDERFMVGLSMPSGGARLGDQTSVAMTILTNDNAHGLIGFNNDSRSRIMSELDSDLLVVLNVDRDGGAFGLVRVNWQLSGAHMTGEITPTSGQVGKPHLIQDR